MSSVLFTPLELHSLTLPHRIVVSPMCMYSARDGLANEFHRVHLGQFALGGAGLIITEATAVTPEGRISPDDLGLWHDQQIGPLGKIADFVHKHGALIGVQLAHAGRKGSTYAPGRGKGAVSPEAGGWTVLGPDHSAYNAHSPTPQAMTLEDIRAVIEAFAASARRAQIAGMDAIEIHAAHGYLLHQFLSPLSNSRQDEYGGSFEHRSRLLLEVVQAVRQHWPQHLPLMVRISATDWTEGGWGLDEAALLAQRLQHEGVSVLDVSSGGLTPQQRITPGPGYQIPFARALKQAAPHLKIMGVGMIETPQQAEQIIESGAADLVALARAFLRDPHWVQRAAVELGVQPPLPLAYGRAGWPGR